MQGSRKTRNSSKGKSSEDGSEVQTGSDTERFQEGQEDSHGEEGSRSGQGEAGFGRPADTRIENVQSKEGSAGPEEDEDLSSGEANRQQLRTEAAAGENAPAGKDDEKKVKPALSVASSKPVKSGSAAGAKLGLALFMASGQSSKGGAAVRPASKPKDPPPLQAGDQQFMTVAMTAAQLSDYQSWLQQRADVFGKQVPQGGASGAAVTFSSVPAATFSSPSVSRAGYRGQDSSSSASRADNRDKGSSSSTPRAEHRGQEVIKVSSSSEEEDDDQPLRRRTKADKGGASAPPRRSDKQKEERRTSSRSGASSAQRQARSSPLQSPKKRPVAAPKCPRCGRTEDHDWLTCRADLADFPRSAAENEFIKKMSQLQHFALSARRYQEKEAAEHSDEEGDNLGDEDSEEEEEEDEEQGEFDDDEDEDGEEDDESDYEEDDDREPSYSASRSSSSSDPTYQPSSSVGSRDAKSRESAAHSSRHKAKHDSPRQQQQARLEQQLAQLTSIVSSLVKANSKSTGGAARRREHSRDDSSTGRQRDHSRDVPAARHDDADIHRSALKDPRGMEGCPELQKDDLLQLSKFEEFEKKYKEYLDKASDRRRTHHKMVHGFRKFSYELRQYIRALLGKSRTLRDTYVSLLPSFELSEEQFLSLENATFVKLYREVCTHHSCLPSQVLHKLVKTPFSRGKTGDDSTLPSIAVKASAAFRERLREQPGQTLKQCTDRQLKEAFIKMLLGTEERHLADFPAAKTWEDVLTILLDMEGTSQADTLLRNIQAHRPTDSTDKVAETPTDTKPKQSAGGVSQSGGGGGAARPLRKPASANEDQRDDSAWEPQFKKLFSEFHPTEADLQDCNTFQQKVKRILTIRDTRKRESEMKEMRSSITKSETAASAPASTSVSRSQLAEEPICFHCKEKGHMKRDCPKRKRTHSSDEE